jgi:RNA polymerase sigma factor (sigma-70 family)
MASAAPERDISALLSAVFREESGRLTGALARHTGDFGLAEECVQEALVRALERWPRAGVPDRPGAWLMTTAKRRAIDTFRRAERLRAHTAELGRAVEAEQAEEPDWAAALDEVVEDDVLRLVFISCHPVLSREARVALTLRLVGGLTTAEIARAFLVPEATMAQRISRAKQSIRASGVPFELPAAEERAARLGAVLHVLYLIFSEGYTASSGRALQRDDLSSEALRLARLLHRLVPDDGEVAGLLALMLLTDARREARTGPAGELVPLDEQDRSRWDAAAIAEGVALVEAALSRGTPGPYQVQAAIAAVHDEAPSTEATDWPQILALYEVLLGMSENPMVALNLAVAVAMVHGPAAGLARLDALAGDPRVGEHHRLDAVRGHLLERAGDLEAARACYRRAAGRTASVPERDYLLMKAARVGEARS